MSFKQKLWSAHMTVPLHIAELTGDILGKDAVAVTVFTPQNNQVRIEAIYDHTPDRSALTAPLAIVATLHKIKTSKLTIGEVPKLDWLKKVAEDFPPLRIAKWTVHGAQHRHAVPNRRYALQIDATNAFGTGEHPTTRGCLLTLHQLLKRKSSVHRMLDMGCGSGILAMAYAKDRRRKTVAVDNDPEAVEVAAGNVRRNGLQHYVRTGRSRGYLSNLVRQHAPYDLVMANILARPLSHMAKDLKRNLRPGGIVILSGILAHQANMVLAAHRLQRLRLIKHIRIGGWSVLALM